MKLANYVAGRWIEGKGEGQPLVDPVRGVELGRATTEGIDFAAALDHARRAGGPALRALSFAERAALIGKIAETLQANRDAYGEIALANSGNTKADAAIDIDGAIGTLRYYARAAAPLGAARTLRDGGLIRMGRDESFQALHVGVPLRGVAIHINAFNFPAWGLWEKVAVAFLAGVPVLAKPATSTSWLAQRMVEDVIKAGVVPDGALSIVCGGAGDLLDHVGPSDAIAFTGSASTAAAIRGHRRAIEAGTRLNIEADSLNATLLGPDVAPGSPEFGLLVAEVTREMTVKAGQKCTAIRRVLAPASVADELSQAIAARLAEVKIGNPRNESVRMGPLVNKTQQKSALKGITALKREARVIHESAAPLVDADPAKGAFIPLTLLFATDPGAGRAVHDVEVFGPVATVLPYRDAADGFALARRGQGSLVASVFSGDPAFLSTAALELADSHGRVLALDAATAKSSTGHGIVMPMCKHGGPGRAGGGEELGGLGALWFYHQRTAIQGPAERLKAIAESAAATG